MFVTHGDTIVFRSDRYGRFGTSSRLRPAGDRGDGGWDGLSGRRGWPPEHRPGRSRAGDEDLAASLLRRIGALEERVARLEARLSGDGPHSGGRRADGSGHDRYRGWPGGAADGYEAAGPGSPGVRVTLHAGAGAQVSLGQVRLIEHG